MALNNDEDALVVLLLSGLAIWIFFIFTRSSLGL